ncbi:trimethylamine methyltransferase family protein [Denitrobaculum tricleocarpae]|uniref:Methyltransferase n=1 Tax=Denitrobaculum tricleocarpae TaxID=2591009 RepID=A0A545TF52_9PROT|nr:trimethylamine methyltransferase family protein [Denitrobaculum tricleocarpae]TQV75796.1 trimethylamine methyltransferase family protein [Denitrobaculum tricleocarpae]
MTQVQRERKSRRAGGRDARKALRAAPLADNVRPIRPGLEGGNFKPLDDASLQKIHQAVLKILAEIGLADAPESGIEIMTAAGATLGDDGRLRFSAALVEDTLAKANRDFTLFGQVEKHDIRPGGNRVHYGTAGAAVHLVDVENRAYRESNLQDIYDAGRIVETLDNVHFFQRPMVARDMEDPADLDLNTVYAAVSGTRKHIGTSFTTAENAQKSIEMLQMIAGGEDQWRARPFVSNTNCFVVPPLKFATESCEVMEVCIRGGMPVLLLSAGQAGATAPAAIAGTVTQATAECIAGLIYVNAIKPGHPAIFGTWPFVSDLRTGAMSGGSGEQALLSAACAQMHHFYGLPGGSAAGMADAKLPDPQSGYEKGITNVMAGLSGLNMVYESVGMHGSLLGFCMESLIIDNDMIGQCLRCVRGIEVTDESISVETMRQVCLEGPGHYLGHAQTLELMQTEYVYPALGDRTSPKEWEELGKPDLIRKAIEEKRRILGNLFPDHISEDLDRQIRANFDIKLPRASMRKA